jgi:hypothetical protein
LAAIFRDSVRANMPWSDVEARFIAAGASISKGQGSRVSVSLNGVDGCFSRLAEEQRGPAQTEPLHRRLGSQHPGE